MHKLLVIAVFSVLLAGCNMSGPGVARVQPMQQPGEEYETTYNSEWVNKKAPDPLGTLDNDRKLSIDLSEREMGVRYLNEDTMIGDKEMKYETRSDKRIRERRETRREAWRGRMGIKTMVDEQKERESE